MSGPERGRRGSLELSRCGSCTGLCTSVSFRLVAGLCRRSGFLLDALSLVSCMTFLHRSGLKPFLRRNRCGSALQSPLLLRSRSACAALAHVAQRLLKRPIRDIGPLALAIQVAQQHVIAMRIVA